MLYYSRICLGIKKLHGLVEIWFSLVLWCLMPLSKIFQLYRESVLLVEETGENH